MKKQNSAIYIRIPKHLHKALIRHDLNISQICREALMKYVLMAIKDYRGGK